MHKSRVGKGRKQAKSCALDVQSLCDTLKGVGCSSLPTPDPLGDFGRPTRSTEFDHLQASRQCQPRVCSMPRYAQTNTSVRTNQEGRVGASFDWLFRVLRLALFGRASSPFHFADWLNLPRCQYLPQFAALGLSIEHRAALD